MNQGILYKVSCLELYRLSFRIKAVIVVCISLSFHIKAVSVICIFYRVCPGLVNVIATAWWIVNTSVIQLNCVLLSVPPTATHVYLN